MPERHFDRPRRAFFALIASLSLCTGIIDLFTDQTAVRSPAYGYLFTWFPLRTWGWLFLISGVMAFIALYFPRLAPVLFVAPALVWGALGCGSLADRCRSHFDRFTRGASSTHGERRRLAHRRIRGASGTTEAE